METPICNFVRDYAESGTLRLHMPGHKGEPVLGMEELDITEIRGADSLYEADGIIARSEANASRVFGCRTLYSTEGSSQCIRAILYLVRLWAVQRGRSPRIAAGRNAHKTFLTAVGLLDLTVDWLWPRGEGSYLSCALTPEDVEAYLQKAPQLPGAVYLTSPDYLGKVADIRGIAAVCHRFGVLLAVDNAHGAYLKFLRPSRHPMDLGADLCCDSAHKTLPVLTGGAYLHLSDDLEKAVGAQAKNAMMLFGSTSPSYLILQSLDRANPRLADYPGRLEAMIPRLDALKGRLQAAGYRLYGGEPLKLTIEAKARGYTGGELADLLRRRGIEPEFADPDYLVLMFPPEMRGETVEILERVFLEIPPKSPIGEGAPRMGLAEGAMSIRDAMLAPSELLPAGACLGRILAVPTVGCPPAVPIVVCGERIDESALACFSYYGIEKCCVVKE